MNFRMIAGSRRSQSPGSDSAGAAPRREIRPVSWPATGVAAGQDTGSELIRRGDQGSGAVHVQFGDLGAVLDVVGGEGELDVLVAGAGRQRNRHRVTGRRVEGVGGR